MNSRTVLTQRWQGKTAAQVAETIAMLELYPENRYGVVTPRDMQRTIERRLHVAARNAGILVHIHRASPTLLVVGRSRRRRS